MELPEPKKHEYPVLLLLAVLFGFVCPALSTNLPNAGSFRLIHGQVPLGVWNLLAVLAECWVGVLVFAALRFPLKRSVPLLLMPVLNVAVNFALVAAWGGWASERGPLVVALLIEPLVFCCWLLVAALAKPLARHIPYEWIVVAVLLLLGDVLVFAVEFGLAFLNYGREIRSSQGATAIFISPRAWALGYLKNGWKELRAFAAAFLTYALLWGIFDKRLFSRIGTLLRRAWNATAA